MATLSSNKIAQAIYLASVGKSASEQQSIFREVVKFLSKRRLLSKTKEILSYLEKIVNKEGGVVAVKLESAQKLEEKTKVHLAENLKQRYASKKIIFKEVINEKLLGGIRIEVDDEVIDLTLKNKLKKLQEHLIK